MPFGSRFASPFDSFLFEDEPLFVSLREAPPKRRCPQMCSIRQNEPARIEKKEMCASESSQVAVQNSMKFSFNIGQFKPEDLKVTVDGRVVTVEGSQSSSDASSSFSSSFKRSFVLSDSVDLDSLYSKIYDQGLLEIGAEPRQKQRRIEIAVEKKKDDEAPVETPIIESVGPDLEADSLSMEQ